MQAGGMYVSAAAPGMREADIFFFIHVPVFLRRGNGQVRLEETYAQEKGLISLRQFRDPFPCQVCRQSIGITFIFHRRGFIWLRLPFRVIRLEPSAYAKKAFQPVCHLPGLNNISVQLCGSSTRPLFGPV